ncbi:MAG: O-methyltransferase [Candidatus Eisenbacteria bacterium]
MDAKTEKSLAYIEAFLHPLNPHLAEVDKQYEHHEKAQPNIGVHVGGFLSWLVRMMQARRVLEFGTCLGYSTIVLAEALRETGGRLIAVESNADFFAHAQRNVKTAGLSDIVEMIHGDAAVVIDELEGPFDLILQDSAKPLYPRLLDVCIRKIRPFGVLAADDALFRPFGVREELAGPIHEYLERIFADPRLISTILPIGDGLAISVRVDAGR